VGTERGERVIVLAREDYAYMHVLKHMTDTYFPCKPWHICDLDICAPSVTVLPHLIIYLSRFPV